MDHLQLTPAKLLYFVTELFKKGSIDEKERVQLKELVVQEDKMLYLYLEEYERHQDYKVFSDNLINRVRNFHKFQENERNQFQDGASHVPSPHNDSNGMQDGSSSIRSSIVIPNRLYQTGQKNFSARISKA